MKAVIISVDRKKAYVLSENGRFMHIPYKNGMKIGAHVDMPRPARHRISKLFNIAACLTAFVFALMYLLYYIRLLNQ